MIKRPVYEQCEGRYPEEDTPECRVEMPAAFITEISKIRQRLGVNNIPITLQTVEHLIEQEETVCCRDREKVLSLLRMIDPEIERLDVDELVKVAKLEGFGSIQIYTIETGPIIVELEVLDIQDDYRKAGFKFMVSLRRVKTKEYGFGNTRESQYAEGERLLDQTWQ